MAATHWPVYELPVFRFICVVVDSICKYGSVGLEVKETYASMSLAEIRDHALEVEIKTVLDAIHLCYFKYLDGWNC